MISNDPSMQYEEQLTVWVLEENLPVNTARTDKSGVKGLNLVSGHDNLDITAVIETVQLVEKLQHGTLDFTFTT